MLFFSFFLLLFFFFTAQLRHSQQLFHDVGLATNLTLITCCQLLWRWHGLFCCVGATPTCSHSEAGSLSCFSDWQTLEHMRWSEAHILQNETFITYPSYNWSIPIDKNTKVQVSWGSLDILSLNWQNDNVFPLHALFRKHYNFWYHL